MDEGSLPPAAAVDSPAAAGSTTLTASPPAASFSGPPTALPSLVNELPPPPSFSSRYGYTHSGSTFASLGSSPRFRSSVEPGDSDDVDTPPSSVLGSPPTEFPPTLDGGHFSAEKRTPSPSTLARMARRSDPAAINATSLSLRTPPSSSSASSSPSLPLDQSHLPLDPWKSRFDPGSPSTSPAGVEAAPHPLASPTDSTTSSAAAAAALAKVELTLAVMADGTHCVETLSAEAARAYKRQLDREAGERRSPFVIDSREDRERGRVFVVRRRSGSTGGFPEPPPSMTSPSSSRSPSLFAASTNNQPRSPTPATIPLAARHFAPLSPPMEQPKELPIAAAVVASTAASPPQLSQPAPPATTSSFRGAKTGRMLRLSQSMQSLRPSKAKSREVVVSQMGGGDSLDGGAFPEKDVLRQFFGGSTPHNQQPSPSTTVLLSPSSPSPAAANQHNPQFTVTRTSISPVKRRQSVSSLLPFPRTVIAAGDHPQLREQPAAPLLSPTKLRIGTRSPMKSTSAVPLSPPLSPTQRFRLFSQQMRLLPSSPSSTSMTTSLAAQQQQPPLPALVPKPSQASIKTIKHKASAPFLRAMQSFESSGTARAGGARQRTSEGHARSQSNDSEDGGGLLLGLAGTGANSFVDEDARDERHYRPRVAVGGLGRVAGPKTFQPELFDVLQLYRGALEDEALRGPSAPGDDPRFVVWRSTNGTGPTSSPTTTASTTSSTGETPKRRSRMPSDPPAPTGSFAYRSSPQATTKRILVAASVERWVAQLTYALDLDGTFDFLLVYRSYLRPIELCRLLIARFEWACRPRTFKEGGDHQKEKEEDEAEELRGARMLALTRTFQVWRFWLRQFFEADWLWDREMRVDVFGRWLNELRKREGLDALALKLVKKLKDLVKERMMVFESTRIPDLPAPFGSPVSLSSASITSGSSISRSPYSVFSGSTDLALRSPTSSTTSGNRRPPIPSAEFYSTGSTGSLSPPPPSTSSGGFNGAGNSSTTSATAISSSLRSTRKLSVNLPSSLGSHSVAKFFGSIGRVGRSHPYPQHHLPQNSFALLSSANGGDGIDDKDSDHLGVGGGCFSVGPVEPGNTGDVLARRGGVEALMSAYNLASPPSSELDTESSTSISESSARDSVFTNGGGGPFTTSSSNRRSRSGSNGGHSNRSGGSGGGVGGGVCGCSGGVAMTGLGFGEDIESVIPPLDSFRSSQNHHQAATGLDPVSEERTSGEMERPAVLEKQLEFLPPAEETAAPVVQNGATSTPASAEEEPALAAASTAVKELSKNLAPLVIPSPSTIPVELPGPAAALATTPLNFRQPNFGLSTSSGTPAAVVDNAIVPFAMRSIDDVDLSDSSDGDSYRPPVRRLPAGGRALQLVRRSIDSLSEYDGEPYQPSTTADIDGLHQPAAGAHKLTAGFQSMSSATGSDDEGEAGGNRYNYALINEMCREYFARRGDSDSDSGSDDGGGPAAALKRLEGRVDDAKERAKREKVEAAVQRSQEKQRRRRARERRRQHAIACGGTGEFTDSDTDAEDAALVAERLRQLEDDRESLMDFTIPTPPPEVNDHAAENHDDEDTDPNEATPRTNMMVNEPAATPTETPESKKQPQQSSSGFLSSTDMDRLADSLNETVAANAAVAAATAAAAAANDALQPPPLVVTARPPTELPLLPISTATAAPPAAASAFVPSSRYRPSTPAAGFGTVAPITRLPTPMLHRSFILDIKTDVLAAQFCLIDAQLLQAIDFGELAHQPPPWVMAPAPRLDRWEDLLCERTSRKQRGDSRLSDVSMFVRRFELMSRWVESEVILTQASQRPQLVGRFVKLAFRCCELSDILATVAIMTGLQTPLVKLSLGSKKWARVGLGLWEYRLFKGLQTFTRPDDAFANVRRAQDKIVDAQGDFFLEDAIVGSNATQIVVGGGRGAGESTGSGLKKAVVGTGGRKRAMSNGTSSLPAARVESYIPFLPIHLDQLARLDNTPDYIPPPVPTSASPALPDAVVPGPLVDVSKATSRAKIIREIILFKTLAGGYNLVADGAAYRFCFKLNVLPVALAREIAVSTRST